MILIVLELCGVSILLILVNFFHLFLLDIIVIIYLIIVIVCEGVIGLVLVTLLVRTHGTDYFKVSSIFIC